MITHCVAKVREKFFSRQDVMVHRAEFPMVGSMSPLAAAHMLQFQSEDSTPPAL